MKLPLSTIIVLALSVGVAWAEGPVEKAGEVATDAVDTAKNVGHKVVKGTKEVVHKVVGAVTPAVRRGESNPTEEVISMF